MKQKTRSISIIVISAIVLMTCLFACLVNPTNSWFITNHSPGIEFVVRVGELKLKLYQNSISNANLLNKIDEDVATPNYIALSGKVLPDESNALTLILSNEDEGSSSMYVRFKFELYALGAGSNTLLATTLSGVTAPSALADGFSLAGDGYYYYRNNSGVNTQFARGATSTIMQAFTVAYTNFITDNATFVLNGSETLRIVLTIEGSLTPSFD